MKLYIKRVAKSRKDILLDLEEQAVQLVKHLVKIIVFQDNGNLKH